MSYQQRMIEYLRANHPRTMRGVEEARAIDPVRFDAVADTAVQWAAGAFGDDSLPLMLDEFVRFTYEINVAQARYEAEGKYRATTYADVFDTVYGDDARMESYMSGDYLTNVLWAHQLQMLFFFEDRFIPRLQSASAIVEFGSGHGFWGLWGIQKAHSSRLTAYDISRPSAELARRFATAAGLESRSSHHVGNVLEVAAANPSSADACICCFLAEHLEDPNALFAAISNVLKARGVAFVAVALTAAAEDHIYEFRRESEALQMAERHGLRVLESLSTNPSRTLRNAKFLPRSLGLICQRRINEIW